jgi:hypothetical protein
MANSLFFKIKDTVNVEKHKIIELFFKDWIDTSCHNQVLYIVNRDVNTDSIFVRADFDRQEDATALKLKGIPDEFQTYLEFVK